MSTKTILCQLAFESEKPVPFFFQDVPETILIGQEPVAVDEKIAARIFEQFPTWIKEAPAPTATVPAVEAPEAAVPATVAPETDPPAKSSTGSRRSQS